MKATDDEAKRLRDTVEYLEQVVEELRQEVIELRKGHHTHLLTRHGGM